MNSGIPLLVFLIIFGTTLIRATVGFGNALIAMPLLVMLLGVKTASPLVALLGPVIAVAMLVLEWEEIDVRAAGKLLLASLVGIPVGLFFLSRAPESLVRGVLGLVLVGFGIYNLWGPPLPTLRQPVFSYLFGFIAGILGGAYNTNGPPVVIYGVMRRWSAEKFRATLQGYFLISGLLILLGHGLSDLWTREVWNLFYVSLPAALLAVLVGSWAARRIPEERFRLTVNLFLIAAGFLMFL